MAKLSTKDISATITGGYVHIILPDNSSPTGFTSKRIKLEDFISAGGGTWGSITGTLSDQTDLWQILETIPAEITEITDIPTTETDDSLVLAPDGSGGVEWRAESGGKTISKNNTFTPSITFDYDEKYFNIYQQDGELTISFNENTNGNFSYIYVNIQTDGSDINFPEGWIVVNSEYLNDYAIYSLIVFFDGVDYQVYLQKIKDIDLAPPEPTFDPSDASINVAITVNPTINFNEAIRNLDASEITDLNVGDLITWAYTDGAEESIDFTATINAGKTIINVAQTSDLDYERPSILSIVDFEDELGNEQTVAQTSTFTTEADAGTNPATLDNFYYNNTPFTIASVADGIDLGENFVNEFNFDFEVFLVFSPNSLSGLQAFLGARQSSPFSYFRIYVNWASDDLLGGFTGIGDGVTINTDYLLPVLVNDRLIVNIRRVSNTLYIKINEFNEISYSLASFTGYTVGDPTENMFVGLYNDDHDAGKIQPMLGYWEYIWMSNTVLSESQRESVIAYFQNNEI